ncbi:MAG: ferric reductase-like transmembrane domain-containing protein [Parcubacteria group bacterium]|jgi:predicted ferric reductase
MGENFFWYLTRSSALVGYFLLWISIFLGLSIRTPLLNRIIKPIYSYKVHCWISLQALIFVLIHGLSLLGDKYVGFTLGNIFIPFFPQTALGVDMSFLALGIISFYIMLILVVTSYFRNNLSHSLWRGVHFLNIGLFVIVFIHALYLGTDMKSGLIRFAFIYANVFLAILFIINLIARTIKTFQKNENLHQSDSEVIEE